MSAGASVQTSSGYATERDELEAELNALRTERYSWWVYWGQLATYYIPRRYRWLVTPNQMNRGSPINGAIIDSTGTIAARTLASGMMSGITSPTRPWFKLRIPGVNPEDEVNPINIWLADCTRRMMRVFQESNFYNAIAVLYLDLAVFGTAPMLIYEDFENVIQCYNPCAGEYYVWNDDKLRVGGIAREMTMTISQMVQKFGLEACSKEVQTAFRQGGASLVRERKIIHFIKSNSEGKKFNKAYTFYECYFEQGAPGDGPEYLLLRPFHEQPFVVPRWETSGNDAYGRSVAMDGLGDVKQLQQETKAKAQAIDKLARPPMVADIELKNKPASTLPGGTTFVSKKDGVGFKPAYENFRPPIQEMMSDLQEVRQRIKDIFFNDLFLMISQLETVRTATEIDARREEKLVMLGPVLERFQTEGLDPVIDRTFAICARAGVFLPAPPEVSGAPIEIEYVSMLAEAQRAANSTGMERFLAQLGNVGAIHPDALDIPNWDRMLTRYALVLGNEPSDLKTADELAQLRAAKARAAQQQSMVEAAPALAQAGKNLSETNVGGGQNALQQIMFGPGGSA
jgi:hypothetical protein